MASVRAASGAWDVLLAVGFRGAYFKRDGGGGCSLPGDSGGGFEAVDDDEDDHEEYLELRVVGPWQRKLVNASLRWLGEIPLHTPESGLGAGGRLYPAMLERLCGPWPRYWPKPPNTEEAPTDDQEAAPEALAPAPTFKDAATEAYEPTAELSAPQASEEVVTVVLPKEAPLSEVDRMTSTEQLKLAVSLSLEPGLKATPDPLSLGSGGPEGGSGSESDGDGGASWAAAVAEYGSSGWDGGENYFAVGSCQGQRRAEELDEALQRDFVNLTRNAFGSFGVATGSADQSVSLTCGFCLKQNVAEGATLDLLGSESLPCSWCGTLLDVASTLRVKMVKEIQNVVSGGLGGVWACSCGALNTGSEQACFRCKVESSVDQYVKLPGTRVVVSVPSGEDCAGVNGLEGTVVQYNKVVRSWGCSDKCRALCDKAGRSWKCSGKCRLLCRQSSSDPPMYPTVQVDFGGIKEPGGGGIENACAAVAGDASAGASEAGQVLVALRPAYVKRVCARPSAPVAQIVEHILRDRRCICACALHLLLSSPKSTHILAGACSRIPRGAYHRGVLFSRL